MAIRVNGFGVRRVTQEPRSVVQGLHGAFRPVIGYWYLIGDTDRGQIFLTNGHKSPEGAADSLRTLRAAKVVEVPDFVSPVPQSGP